MATGRLGSVSAVRVLLSAYACGPSMGSEPEVGFQALRAALRRHEVWLLTQPHMVAPVTAALRDDVASGRLHVEGLSPRATVRQDGLVSLVRTQVRHDRWQRTAAARAAELHARVRFDVAHHVTLAAYWMRTGISQLDVPLVWGPVGGAVEPPVGLLGVLGARGLLEDAVRSSVRLVAGRLPDRRAVVEAADVILVQNASTARRLGSPARVRVLPNALAASVPAVGPGRVRRRDVAVVGRIIAWKATPLAVRVLRHLPDDVPLRVYGHCSPDQRRRLDRAGRRWGVDDRVELMGNRNRPELLERVAESGVLLHPSLHDEASLSIAEALALGTPVVALDHGGPASVAGAWGRDVPAQLVRPSTPGRTARALGEAVTRALQQPPPVPVEPVPPKVDFAAVLLEAYEEAVATTRGG